MRQRKTCISLSAYFLLYVLSSAATMLSSRYSQSSVRGHLKTRSQNIFMTSSSHRPVRSQRGPLIEWKLWMPGSPSHETRRNPNHWGVNIEWKRWLSHKKAGTGSSVDESESGSDDEWQRWSYGSFASAGQLPTKQQAQYQSRINALLPTAELKEIDPLWEHLTDEEVRIGIEAVKQYVTADRRAKFDKVLEQRTDRIRFVFENPSNANNCWAALRTFDSFGLQFTEVIGQKESYHSEWRRETMTQALGAQKWLSLQQHDDPRVCLERLKSQGYRILATDIHASSKTVYDVDWTSQKTAVVLGNEATGISDIVRSLADDTFYLPMKGFAESLNVSAFCAVLCGLLEQRGALDPRLSSIRESDRNRILLTWMSRTAPSSLEVMRRAGLNPGNKLYDTIGKFTTKP